MECFAAKRDYSCDYFYFCNYVMSVILCNSAVADSLNGGTTGD